MLKRILIPLDPGPYTEKCIELGCIMANRLDAELTGMVILDIPGIEKSVGPVPDGSDCIMQTNLKLKSKKMLRTI